MTLTCVTAVFNAVKAGNREQLIRCVESVAKLKTEHEHLVYDGASTDGTEELLRELEAKTPGLKVVSEPDTGVYNALNKGVRDAQGEWFYVLGCDDYICNPEVMDGLLSQAVHGEELLVAPVKRDVKRNFYVTRKDLSKILWTFPYSHQSVIMFTSVLREYGGFDEQYRFCADWDLLFKCHLAARTISYSLAAFAFYAAGGLSERRDIGNNDWSIIYRRLYGYDDAEYRRFRARGTPRLRSLPRFLVHRDFALRYSAWVMLRRIIIGKLHLAFMVSLVKRCMGRWS